MAGEDDMTGTPRESRTLDRKSLRPVTGATANGFGEGGLPPQTGGAA
jgi:hypothetical protein